MVSLSMNYRALRRGLLFMCLINPVFGANNAKKGDVTSLELFEYLGSLMETNEGLFGPDLFIEKGISDATDGKPQNETSKKQSVSLEQSENKRRKGGANEN